ncbi:MAG: hypothetical protein K0S07_84 [Chlamydiales bacterium]|jgi:flagellar biosynthesis chaperone FliJ|nr:hypothetical protein [Chlamydiales bacterium]
MKKVVYPLKQVLEVKIKRMEDAEKRVHEKRKLLEIEQQKLIEREKERDRVLEHHKAKLQQLRDTLDQGTTSHEVEIMKNYLKLCKENLAVEEKKVKEQKSQVEVAEKNLELARQEWRDKRKEVDKLQTHRGEWAKEMKIELDKLEEYEQEELGNTIFLSRMQQNR